MTAANPNTPISFNVAAGNNGETIVTGADAPLSALNAFVSVARVNNYVGNI